MIFSKKIANTIYIVLFFTYILGEYLITLSKNIDEEKNYSSKEMLKEIKKIEPNQNYLYLIDEKRKIKENLITKHFDSYYKDYIHYVSFKDSKNSKDIKNEVALGIDKKFHLTNYFLEGYAPFKTDKLWIPLQSIARQKTYLLDDAQYLGYKEVWQTSSQAFKFPSGDCEDHAIALADWLIEMGEDARVVIGKYNRNGHAWVVLFKDNQQFILESTQKRNLLQPYRLAKYQTSYKPEAMFNRENFWFNNGSINTTNYNSKNWSKKSIYIKKTQS